MRKKLLFLLAFFIAVLFSQGSFAGVIIGNTRLIYNEYRKEATIPIINPDSDISYLIQSWFERWDSADIAPIPFAITPPLFKLNGGKENILRIVRTEEHNLPNDRETIFWLNIKSIPSTKKLNQNQLFISIKAKIKLIYRPELLNNEKAALAYHSVTFARCNNRLTISNPTPYHINFYRLNVAGYEVNEPLMLRPYSENQIDIPNHLEGKILWSVINDYGGITPEKLNEL